MGTISGYVDIKVKGKYGAKTHRTSGIIYFCENGGEQGIQFKSGGHGYFYSFEKVISITPVKDI